MALKGKRPSTHKLLQILGVLSVPVLLISGLISITYLTRGGVNISSDDSEASGAGQIMMISPEVSLTDGEYIRVIYQVLLGKDYDDEGFSTKLEALYNEEKTREQLFEEFQELPEFWSSTTLKDNVFYIRRVFNTLYASNPDNTTVNEELATIKNYNGTGLGTYDWYEYLNYRIEKDEYKVANCAESYYFYDEPVKDSSPRLGDLFEGTASFEPPTPIPGTDNNFLGNAGISIIPNPSFPKGESSYKYLAFFRTPTGGNQRKIQMAKTNDGLEFKFAEDVFTVPEGWRYLDPNVSIDYSICPTRYVMTFECFNSDVMEGSGTCMSVSSDPQNLESWRTPKVLVDGCDNDASTGCRSPRYLSASTGVTFFDGDEKYVGWNEIDDGRSAEGDSGGEGDERGESKLTILTSEQLYHRTEGIGHTYDFSEQFKILKAMADISCTSSWDCNYRGMQDMVRDGDHYYAIYNGANYFRCTRPGGQPNQWGLSIARSTSPTTGFDEFLPESLVLKALRDDVCAISYPKIAVIDGEIYLYYQVLDDTGPHLGRSKLLWNSPR